VGGRRGGVARAARGRDRVDVREARTAVSSGLGGKVVIARGTYIINRTRIGNLADSL